MPVDSSLSSKSPDVSIRLAYYDISPTIQNKLYNQYPGACCDVPSHLYSLSFELNPDGSHRFPPAEEIHAYQQHVADKYGQVQPVLNAPMLCPLATQGQGRTHNFRHFG
jgi:hypothetical protein